MANEPAEDEDGLTPPAEIDDDGTFAAWFAENWSSLVSYGRVVAKNPDDAEDLAMWACEKLMLRWKRRRPEHPRAWACKVMKHRHFRTTKLRSRARAREELVAPQEATSPQLPDLDLRDQVRALPRRQGQAIALRYAADLTQDDVANAMGIRPGTAAALLNQARNNLRTNLGGEP